MKILVSSVLSTLLFIVLFGIGFPVLLTGLGRAFPHQADGSFVTDSKGQIVGSELIAQGFTKPEFFHPRPSAAGNGYDPTNSGGTNLGPTSDKLINGIHKKLPDGKDDPGNFDGIVDLAKQYRTENNLPANAPVPADAVTRSASGLDPHISLENASIQATRVATARKMSVEDIKNLIEANTDPAFLGLYGEPAVNVLKLNLALSKG
jgi:potassium-transporting ATPase KdpC subunit